MSAADEPVDDWDRSKREAQWALIREAARMLVTTILPMLGAILVHLASLVLAAYGVAALPPSWIPCAVLYLNMLVGLAVTIIARTSAKYNREGLPPPIRAATLWRRRILSRITCIPLAYLAFLGLGATLIAGIAAGIIWVLPVLMSMRRKSADQRLRTLHEFLRGREKNGPEA